MAIVLNKKISLSLTVIVYFLLTGCSTHVVVTGEYPPVLAQPLDYNVGLVLDSSFTDYSFTREKDDQKIIITLGSSQTELFSHIFESMFTSMQRLQGKPQITTNFMDLVVIPRVEKLQISMPDETSLNVFEVWIQYKLEIFDTNSALITEWSVSSYGRTQTRFLKSTESALHQATNSALRDAGVQIVIGFNSIPKIRDWVKRKMDSNNAR
ncbi:MAG: hypothetical protein ACI9LL_000303 [Porticoccus sp.]|jgi:hypothetical protein